MAIAAMTLLFPSLVLAQPGGVGDTRDVAPNAAPDYAASTPPLGNYVALGWNDLGMHCMNKNYDSLVVLPPFNNINVTLIKRGAEPQITTQGVTLTYRFPANTYSKGKVNFWSYEDKLFGVNLPDNIGLTGNGLAGSMKPGSTMLTATGVPITPFEDATSTTLQAYQLVEVTAVSNGTSITLDRTTFCVPTSTEIHCDKCHPAGDGYSAEGQILRKHDEELGTQLYASRPVLCASCHASNALGAPGVPGVENLSYAIHRFHGEEAHGITCYDCHPGVQTKCLRGAMYIAGKACTDCHGSISNVASTINAGRRPWLDEPKCSQCHDVNHSENAGTLYRNSVGHGGLNCTVCHNSPHSELPTVQARDSIQALRVQGAATYIKACTVCHVTVPSGPGPHGYRPATEAKNWTIYQ